MPFDAPLRVTVEIRLGGDGEVSPRFFRASERVAVPPELWLEGPLPFEGEAPATLRFALPEDERAIVARARVQFDPQRPQRSARAVLLGLAPEELERVERYIEQRNLL